MPGRSVLVILVLAACTTAPGPTTSGQVIPTPDSTPTSSSGIVDPTTSQAPTTTSNTISPADLTIESFPVPQGSRPHDVAPAADGGVWYTAQGSGELGWLDPGTGDIRHIDLGDGSRPHGVIVDDEGTPWITDGGLNAIVSVGLSNDDVTVYPLPAEAASANLNTAVFDDDGILWFTGQSGVYGSLDPDTGEMQVYPAPGGTGPYGITVTPGGSIFYASLAGSHVGSISEDGKVTVLEPPTPGQGARRVWSDSVGNVWVSEWNSGAVSRYDPGSNEWSTWPLPGDDPAAYAVYVDEEDTVWLSDFGANAIVRFDPSTERFDAYALPHDPGDVRQILGRPGEVWGAESAADHLVLIRTK